MFKEKLFTRKIEVTDATIKCVDVESEKFKEVNISIPYTLAAEDILKYASEKMNIVAVKVIQAEHKEVKVSVALSDFYNFAYTAGKIEQLDNLEQEDKSQSEK